MRACLIRQSFIVVRCRRGGSQSITCGSGRMDSIELTEKVWADNMQTQRLTMSDVGGVAVKIGSEPVFVACRSRNTHQKTAPPIWRIESPHLDVLQEHAFSLRSRKDPRRIGPPPRISGPATHPHCLKSAKKKRPKKAL